MLLLFFPLLLASVDDRGAPSWWDKPWKHAEPRDRSKPGKNAHPENGSTSLLAARSELMIRWCHRVLGDLWTSTSSSAKPNRPRCEVPHFNIVMSRESNEYSSRAPLILYISQFRWSYFRMLNILVINSEALVMIRVHIAPGRECERPPSNSSWVSGSSH